MKRYQYFLFVVLMAGISSCQKVANTNMAGDEIIISVAERYDAVVTTKTTAVTEIPSTLYWGSTTGTRGTNGETRKYHNNGSSLTGTVSGSTIATGKYQTYVPTAYNHYLSNVSFSLPGTGNVTIAASNSTDVVAGWIAGSSSSSPSITLDHIFARTGTLTLNTQTGYSLSVQSWAIESLGAITGTAGTYNLSTGAWTAVSSTLSSITISSSSDLYVIPGTYRIYCTYELSKGDWAHTFTKYADVTLVGGKINNITGTATGGNATEINLSVSLTAWGQENINMSLN